MRASTDAVRGGLWRDKTQQPHSMQEALSAAGGAGALAFWNKDKPSDRVEDGNC